MANNKISFNREELTGKVTQLDTISDKLSQDTLIKPLIFGSSSQTATSKGDSVTAVKELNTELDVIAKKLAKLNKQTANYLNSIITTFEEADGV